jgi:peptidoglycan/LPS O-acetylase OafA/YrhL
MNLCGIDRAAVIGMSARTLRIARRRVRLGAHRANRRLLGTRDRTRPRVGEGFRPDIQGLRGVAVLLVALNHAGLSWLRGGYIGVDVFFVISGFLITGWLVARTEKMGRVPFARFYAARARRILPMASLAIAAIVIASYYWLNYVRALSVFRDAEWAAVFAANVRFSDLGTDYFARTNPPSPLQHFWTLAVEEQFYIVWPIVVAAALVLRRRGAALTAAAIRRRVTVLLVAIIAASLVYSIRQTASSPTAAYFSTIARAWELAIGAAVAVAAYRLRTIPRQIRAVVGWLGIGGIAVSAVAFSAGTPFPGYAALLPVTSAAAVIIAGLEGSTGWAASAVLGRQPLRLVGDVSYGFYLWHWPLLVIPAEYYGHPLSLVDNVALLSVAFVISVGTYYLYENPIRYSEGLSKPSAALALWPITVSIVVTVASLGVLRVTDLHPPAAPAAFLIPPSPVPPITTPKSHSKNGGNQIRTVLDPYEQAVAKSASPSQARRAPPSSLYPPLTSLSLDQYNLGTSCSAGFGSSTTSPICHLGDATGRQTLVVFGDSHAQMWMPAFISFGHAYHWMVIPLVKEGCTAIVWSSAASVEKGPCKAWFSWAMAQLSRIRPDATVLATSFSGDAANGDPTAIRLSATGVGIAINAIAKRSAKPILLEDIPYPGRSPIDCLLAHGATLGSCTFSENESYTLDLESQVAQRLPVGVPIMPVEQWFCANHKCPMVIGRIIAYADSAHISKTYATELSTPFSQTLRTTIRRWGTSG